MSNKMSFDAKHGEVQGEPRSKFGVHYMQNGKFYDVDGDELDPRTGVYASKKAAEKRAKAEAARKQNAEAAATKVAAIKKTKAEAAAEAAAPAVVEQVDYDTESIQTLEDFDEYVDFLGEIEQKAAKASLKTFALDVVGMGKLAANNGLDKMVALTRAELKALLEDGI